MSRSKLIAGNWKMNFTPHEASLHLHHLSEHIDEHSGVDVVLCAPFVDLYSLSKEIDGNKFKLGAQNLHPAEAGPYTGEVSAAMLRGLVQYVILGHSERRAMGETDEFIAQKMAAALRHNIKPILCVGETLTEREHGATKQVVLDQLNVCLADVTAEEMDQVAIAYEPVWAISKGDGRGHTATPDQVQPIVRAIRDHVKETFGAAAAQSTRVLYGGSSNPDNCKAFLQIDGVDGLLPGGASLKYLEFAQMVKIATELA